MTQQPVQIIVGYDGNNNPKYYNYLRFESRGIAVSAATRSGKSTFLFELKREFRSKVPDAQIVSIAQDRDEFRQRDEIPFVIIGEKGEVPIDVRLAKQTGENTRKMHTDVIVDLNSLQTEKEQDEFASEFLKGIQLDRDESFWEKPCILFIDEVQTLCTSGATKFPKTRDAIVNLAKTCLKKNILLIVVSHRMKDFYVNARDEITNHIVGYLDNTSQQEFACEMLKLPYTAMKTIDEFGMTRGRFFTRGFDISNNAVEIQVKPTKLYEKGRVIIPKLSSSDRIKADALRDSLTIEDDISIETRLRFQNTRLQSKNDELSETQMTEENIIKFREQGFMIGYNKSTDDITSEIEQSRPTGLAGLVKHGIQYEIKQEGWKKKLVIR